jgi:hypothetical protein
MMITTKPTGMMSDKTIYVGVLKIVKNMLRFSIVLLVVAGYSLPNLSCLIMVSYIRTQSFREIKSEDKSYRHFILPYRTEVASLLDVLGRFLGQQHRGDSVDYPGHHNLDKTGLWINIINNSNISTAIGHTGRIPYTPTTQTLLE